jgi:hypothetical protein
MSIASQLQALEGNIEDAYDMVAQRGGTMPQRKNMENLDDAIATIPTGSVSTPAVPMPCVNITNGKAERTAVQLYSLPNTITEIGKNLYREANTHDLWVDYDSYMILIDTFDFSSVITISGSRAFSYAFYGASFSGTISSVVFDFQSLVTVSGDYAFDNAWAWAELNRSGVMLFDFRALTNITGQYAFREAFAGNDYVASISFPSLSNLGNYTNQFDDMLDSCSDVTVHFPAALQSVIGSWASVQNGFGGTNTTVLFDL